MHQIPHFSTNDPNSQVNRCHRFFMGILGKLGRKLGKNYPIFEMLVGETFMNQWKNIYPWSLEYAFSVDPFGPSY